MLLKWQVSSSHQAKQRQPFMENYLINRRFRGKLPSEMPCLAGAKDVLTFYDEAA